MTNQPTMEIKELSLKELKPAAYNPRKKLKKGDKEYEKIVQILCPSAKRVYTVDLPNKERTLPAEKLAECVRDCMTEQLSVYAEKSIGDAVAKAYTYATEDSGKRVVIACGSLSYLSEVIRCMEGCVQNPQRKERI